MELGRFVFAGLAVSVAGLGAAGETVFVRPGPCAADQTYLLAGNSGAIIRVEAPSGNKPERRVIVYRDRSDAGWASRSLLGRFDLKLDDQGVTIINSGNFCRSTK